MGSSSPLPLGLDRVLRALCRRKAIASLGADAEHGSGRGGQLKRALGLMDVVGYGVSSTLGAGLFVVTGKAAHDFAGPAVCVSYVLAGAASLLSALCYAEFATKVPVAGSAYSYAYVSLGEGWAWLVGWNLVLEYGVSASAIARGWSDYLVHFCSHVGLSLPRWIHALEIDLPGQLHLTASPLAAAVVGGCTMVLLMGVSESARLNLAITTVNLALIVFVVLVGAANVQPANWSPWAPQGLDGIVAGSGYVFFSYIGFDSVCTLAEEMKRPQRDLPAGVIGSLAIVTVLYVSASLVLTGMVHFSELDLRAPMSEAFASLGMPWTASIVALGSVTALTGTALCSLFGQPRIFYRIAQDGLLPQAFATVNPDTQVPVFGTLWTGVGAGTMAFLFDADVLMDLISIGTLLAFAIVCLGLLCMRYEASADSVGPSRPAGAWATSPLVWIWSFCVSCLGCTAGSAADLGQGFCMFAALVCSGCILRLSRLPQHGLGHQRLTSPREEDTTSAMGMGPVTGEGFTCPWVPFLPCLGIWVNCYLIAGLPAAASVRLVVWSAVGLSIYLLYGVSHSKLQAATKTV